MKYGFLIILLYVSSIKVNGAHLSRRPTMKERRMAEQNPQPNQQQQGPQHFYSAQQRAQQTQVAVDERGRSIFNIGQILDPLLGKPITFQAVVLEILKYPLKQSLVSVHWTNEHFVRRIIQSLTEKMDKFYDTYLDSEDLPIFVAIAAFVLGTTAESFTKTDEILDKLDNFISDILDVIVGD